MPYICILAFLRLQSIKALSKPRLPDLPMKTDIEPKSREPMPKNVCVHKSYLYSLYGTALYPYCSLFTYAPYFHIHIWTPKAVTTVAQGSPRQTLRRILQVNVDTPRIRFDMLICASDWHAHLRDQHYEPAQSHDCASGRDCHNPYSSLRPEQAKQALSSPKTFGWRKAPLHYC
jgi:hypothetical protein